MTEFWVGFGEMLAFSDVWGELGKFVSPEYGACVVALERIYGPAYYDDLIEPKYFGEPKLTNYKPNTRGVISDLISPCNLDSYRAFLSPQDGSTPVNFENDQQAAEAAFAGRLARVPYVRQIVGSVYYGGGKCDYGWLYRADIEKGNLTTSH